LVKKLDISIRVINLIIELLFNVLLMNDQKPSAMTNRQELDSKNKTELIQIALEILKKKQPSLI